MAETKYKFAKLYETDTGQILITITRYMNAGEVSLQFNDGDEGIHRFNLIFAGEDSDKAQKVFDEMDQSSAERIITQGLQKADAGVTEGFIDDLSEVTAPIH